MKKFLSLQILIVAAGAAFAWSAVFGDFSRFFAAGGQLAKFSGCRFPNPLATPCFYGAAVFLLALAGAAFIWQMQKRSGQKKLAWLLFCGSLFAWSVNAWEFYKFFRPHTGTYIGCSGLAAKSPLYTPCFTGACFYLAAFLFSLWLLKKWPVSNKPAQ